MSEALGYIFLMAGLLGVAVSIHVLQGNVPVRPW
jgi:hypothetical protein